jgi:hypothetical protein
MIAVEVFFVLVLIGLGVVFGLQHFIRKDDRGHKGDAEKSPEEIESHQPHR